jgi:hypothetical protein
MPSGMPTTIPTHRHRRRLPAHGHPNLGIGEPERLQQADLAAAGHADHEQVQERRGAEEGRHQSDDQREVHRLSKIDE